VSEETVVNSLQLVAEFFEAQQKRDAIRHLFLWNQSKRIELRKARAVKQKGPGDLFVSEMHERVLFEK